ncbi:hypothetical protein H4S08_004032 [Coemansia sp. RSA 1365]|nr:hypothetical protein H4S08_004032 [Coemansia sp. RSA 1365]
MVNLGVLSRLSWRASLGAAHKAIMQRQISTGNREVSGTLRGHRQEFASDLTGQLIRQDNGMVSRSVSVLHGDAVKAYGRLNRILAENDIRRELRLRERYEKPTYKRQRLRRESHARRFKDEVRRKVHLIYRMSRWGL